MTESLRVRRTTRKSTSEQQLSNSRRAEGGMDVSLVKFLLHDLKLSFQCGVVLQLARRARVVLSRLLAPTSSRAKCRMHTE